MSKKKKVETAATPDLADHHVTPLALINDEPVATFPNDRLGLDPYADTVAAVVLVFSAKAWLVRCRGRIPPCRKASRTTRA